MEEIEVPTEQLQEDIHHHAQHDGQHEGQKWFLGVALSSAIFATLAAIGALLSGHHSNEAIIHQMRASDQWAYYQAKGIKAAVLETRVSVLKAVSKAGAMSAEKLEEKLTEYKNEQEEIKKEASEHELESSNNLQRHMILARSVTMFQVAIAIAAISILVKRRRFWYASIGLGIIGALFLLQDLLLY